MRKLNAHGVGSSPRGRGKLTSLDLREVSLGLIPARAGKTHVWSISPLHIRAHPRAGGENDNEAQQAATLAGSSPRGRGKRKATDLPVVTNGLIPARAGKTGQCLGECGDGGLIPARAGKTRVPVGCHDQAEAHPRAGGENSLRLESAAWSPGSSPRGRGKREGGHPGLARGGLIPARAGKTRARPGRVRRPWAHPRAGGENSAPASAVLIAVGSSPRGRGKPHRGVPDRSGTGLIPARAGKTGAPPVVVLENRAHPRAGGENLRLAEEGMDVLGSSPRGRGKLGVAREPVSVEGLIPARAGKTTRQLDQAATGEAHPRAGGENSWLPSDTSTTLGSSPRGRGKPPP